MRNRNMRGPIKTGQGNMWLAFIPKFKLSRCYLSQCWWRTYGQTDTHKKINRRGDFFVFLPGFYSAYLAPSAFLWLFNIRGAVPKFAKWLLAVYRNRFIENVGNSKVFWTHAHCPPKKVISPLSSGKNGKLCVAVPLLTHLLKIKKKSVDYVGLWHLHRIK